MSIDETQEKIKPFYGILLILSVAIIFFALGRLSVQNKPKNQVKIEYPAQLQSASIITSQNSSTTETISTSTPPQDGPVIGSKSGKKYYFPWCGTVKRIKKENQVYFSGIASAKSAGFTPGGNCKGLW